jgi:integrase
MNDLRLEGQLRAGTFRPEASKARTVPIGAPVLRALKAWRFRSRCSTDSDLVCPNSRGGSIAHENMLRGRYVPMCAAAGVTGVSWHALRPFAVSCWIEQKLSPKTVQAFAGHANLQLTQGRYGHLFPSEDRKVAMDKIARALLG